MAIQKFTLRNKSPITPEIKGRMSALRGRMAGFLGGREGVSQPPDFPNPLPPRRPSPTRELPQRQNAPIIAGPEGFTPPPPQNLPQRFGLEGPPPLAPQQLPRIFDQDSPRPPGLPVDQLLQERRRRSPQITPEIREKLRALVEQLRSRRIFRANLNTPQLPVFPFTNTPELPISNFPGSNTPNIDPGFTRQPQQPTRPQLPEGFAKPLAPRGRRSLPPNIRQILQRFQGAI